MYSFLAYMRPFPEKMGELLEALGERNQVSNANGIPHMVARQMFAERPTLLVVTRFENLRSFQDWQERNRNDPAFQEAGWRFEAAVALPIAQELTETLVQSERTGEVNFFLSATSFAAPGKAGELRQALEKAFPAVASNGTVMRELQRQIAPEDGANYTVSLGFSELAGLEEAMSNSAFGSTGASLVGLLNRPIRQRLYRVVLPFIQA